MPIPGEMYVFPCNDDSVGLEWLIVRPHPDDDNLWLAVPTDDFPLIGSADVSLSHVFPVAARCGQAAWLHTSILGPRRRIDLVPLPATMTAAINAQLVQLKPSAPALVPSTPRVNQSAVADVRRQVHELATGAGRSTHEQQAVDLDPEYQAWILAVACVREALTHSGAN